MRSIFSVRNLISAAFLCAAGGFLYQSYLEKVDFEKQTVELCDRINRAKQAVPDAVTQLLERHGLKGHFDVTLTYSPNTIELPPRGIFAIELKCDQ